MTALPLAKGFVGSGANGINDAGFILEGDGGGVAVGHALLWHPDNSPLDLDAWLDSASPTEGGEMDADDCE